MGVEFRSNWEPPLFHISTKDISEIFKGIHLAERILITASTNEMIEMFKLTFFLISLIWFSTVVIFLSAELT